MCEQLGALEEFRKAEDRLQREEERRGTAGRMTGWERHSLRSVPRVKVGKVRVQEVYERSHFHVGTSVYLQGEAVTRRDGFQTLGF